MPPQSARDGLKPSADAVDRFRRDLGALIDTERDSLLVAVSGGPDSVALLLLSHELLGERCQAATVDHGLRTESATEAAWVAALCHERRIRHTILSGSLPDRVHGSGNLSQRAREFRFRLLFDRARILGCKHVATGHHADDQLETIVMRLNRGAGLSGLSGVRRSLGVGHRIIRPLLDWRRQELATVVEACGIEALSDPTNADDRFDRARLRKVLAHADWLDARSASFSAKALGDADDALEWSTDELFRRRVVERLNALVLDADLLPDEYLRRLALRCLARFNDGRLPDGPETMRMIARLKGGGIATLADVKVSPTQGYWTFSPAPPRRNT